MSKARILKLRADTSVKWTAANPTLEENEIAVDLTTGLFKIGDGLTEWTSLAYFKPTIPVILPTYEVLNAPDATDYEGAQIYISNETGGSVVAFSDGTNWLRCTDRTIIS